MVIPKVRLSRIPQRKPATAAFLREIFGITFCVCLSCQIASAMNEKKVTINEMIARMVAEARRLGYSESSIWTNIQPGLRAFAIYYGKKGISLYDPEITSEYVVFLVCFCAIHGNSPFLPHKAASVLTALYSAKPPCLFAHLLRWIF